MARVIRTVTGVLVLAFVALSAPVAMASTIGSPLISRATRDYNWGGLFVYDLPLLDIGSTVAAWAFYSDGVLNGPGTTGLNNQITPLLFTKDPVTLQFTIAGIGTTRTNLNTGVQEFAFGLLFGTDIVGANTYFGWRDGNISGSVTNDGSIVLDFGGGPGLYYYPTNPPTTFSAPIAPGQTYTFSDATTAARTYSVQVTTVPEPATLVLLGTGALGLIAARRRKQLLDARQKTSRQ